MACLVSSLLAFLEYSLDRRETEEKTGGEGGSIT